MVNGKMYGVTQEYNLQVTNPNLAKQWHPDKNGTLTPNVVTPMSGKKVWWICRKGHEWEAHISHRSNGIGCPYCSGKRPSKDRNLQVAYPDLAKEWHPTKNVGLTPRDVTPRSGKKVWWICIKGHAWEATVSHRSQGSSCPFCSGNRVCDDNCLQTINPQLSEQWHPTKNGNLTPRDVTAGSRKKVWWICNKGHGWQASVATRNKGTGCPYCTGQAVCRDNSLQTINPILSRQWHPRRNSTLTQGDVTANSGRKVWWICNNGHEWQAVVANRNRGRGCPYCAGRNDKQ